MQRLMQRLFVFVLCTLLYGLCVQAAPLVNETRVVAANDSYKAMVPDADDFQVSVAGDYTITLLDVSPQGAETFSALSVTITQGEKLIAKTSSTATISLSTGSYRAQVLGVTNGVSAYSVKIQRNNDTPVLERVDSITKPVDNDQSSLQQALTLTAGHTYTLTVTDHAFPATLNSLSWSVAQGASVICARTGTDSCDFTAAANNELFAVATGTGLFSVKVTDTQSGAVILAASHPVGELPEPITVTLPAGSAELLTMDLGSLIEAPLQSFQAVLLQSNIELTRQSATGTTAFTAGAGEADLYINATAGSAGVGAYSVQLSVNGQVLYGTSAVLNPTQTSDPGGYSFETTELTAGTYSFNLKDFQFPQTFTALSAVATQNGTVLAELDAAGSAQFSISQGKVNIVVLGTPASTGLGLFGVRLTNGATQPAFEATQGVGARFFSHNIEVPTSGSYRFKAADLGSPAALSELSLAAIRGTELVGQYYGAGGSGSFDFNAAPGTYTLNFLAKTGASAAYGMYGYSVYPPPSVKFSAAANTVKAGDSVLISWSTADADSCTASNGWRGTRGVSGSETVGPVNAAMTLSLTCTGPGGSTTQTLNIGVTNESSSGGGGGALPAALSGLLALLCIARRYRTSMTR